MSTARPVLIVEDNDALRQVLVDHLVATSDFQPIEAASLTEARQHLGAPNARFDAIILDLNLPDGDGCDFCVQLRQQGHNMPIIMLTASAEDADVVRGLDAGANDYVSKPFRINELLARLAAQLRLFDNSEDAVFTIGAFTFRPGAKLLEKPEKSERIRLTDKEVGVLKFLYRTGNRVVSRQVLLNEVWGYNAAITTHTLETHIYRLRQKIEVDPTDCRLLMTVPGGYQLDATGQTRG